MNWIEPSTSFAFTFQLWFIDIGISVWVHHQCYSVWHISSKLSKQDTLQLSKISDVERVFADLDIYNIAYEKLRVRAANACNVEEN